MRIPGANYQDASWQKIGYAATQALTDAIVTVGNSKGLDALLADEKTFLATYPEIWAVAQQALRTRSYGNFKNEQNCHRYDGLVLAESLLNAIWDRDLVGNLWHDLHRKNKKKASTIKSTCAFFLKDLRDKIDADECSAVPEVHAMFEAREALLPKSSRRKGAKQAMSTDHLFRLRTVEQAMAEFRQFLENWENHPEKVGTLLGIEVLPTVEPLGVRRILQGLRRGQCKATWLLDYHQKFAPREKESVGHQGPILCGKKLTSSKWALDSLEARIDGYIGELRDYAELSDTFASQLPTIRNEDGDLLDLNNHEVIANVFHTLSCEADTDSNRLLEAPRPYEPTQDSANLDDQDEPETSDEQDANGNEPEWDIAREDEDNEDSPGSSDMSEVDDVILQAISADCIQGFPLAIQVAVLIEIFPKGDADLLWLLRNMDAFGRFGMEAPSLRALTPKFLAQQLAAANTTKPLSERKFMAQVKLAQVKFLDCCQRRLIAYRNQ